MHRRIPLLFAALAVAGCDETSLSTARADIGLVPQDGGISGPLPLQVGMAFTYQGRLTARQDQQVERNSVYNLTITITAIDETAGTLEYRATGNNMLLDDWTDTYDFSSWVGRVGPSTAVDQVDENRTVQIDLNTVARAPGRSNPKVLPATGPFFFDVRAIAALRAQFDVDYAGSQPTVTDPENSNGVWRFSFEQTDPTIITYNDQRRFMVLEYDPRGFLTKMTESLGRIDNPPSGDCRLELQSGP